jgi:hypothetical protein
MDWETMILALLQDGRGLVSEQHCRGAPQTGARGAPHTGGEEGGAGDGGEQGKAQEGGGGPRSWRTVTLPRCARDDDEEVDALHEHLRRDTQFAAHHARKVEPTGGTLFHCAMPLLLAAHPQLDSLNDDFSLVLI